MSQHHRNAKWSTDSPKHRARIEKQLPQPCVDCGSPVYPEHKWQVGHRDAIGNNGPSTVANIGPSHTACNLRSGGRMGARKTNARRTQTQAREQDIRPW
jgi:hypothetical protein